MAEEIEFGDFSSAFPNSSTAGHDFGGDNSTSADSCQSRDIFNSSNFAPKDVTLGESSDDNGAFADFTSFATCSVMPPLAFCENSVPEIPPLPDDLRFEPSDGDVGVFSDSPVVQLQPSSIVSGVETSSAFQDSTKDEFGDFEYSLGLETSEGSQPQTMALDTALVPSGSISGMTGERGVAGGDSFEVFTHKEGHSEAELQAHLTQAPPCSNSANIGFADFTSFQDSTAEHLNKDEFNVFAQAPLAKLDSSSQPSLPVDVDSDFGTFSSVDNAFGGFESATPTTISKETSKEFSQFAPHPVSYKQQNLSASKGNISKASQTVFNSSFSSVEVIKARGKESVQLDIQNATFDFRRSVDFTVPLYKWDNSHLQQYFYGSIKVDPMLIKKVDSAVLLAMMPAVVGQSAAVDLMQSFGFEEGLEPSSPTDTSSMMAALSEFHGNSDESGPSLLDLSLPTSPSVELQKDSFTLDADLLSLDFNTSPEQGKLTSREQLLINERLVVNRTTWMDSELMALGGADLVPALDPTTPPSSPSTSVSRKATIEQQLEQLGLDTTKTTLASTALVEMSISARLVYDRLPDLSFMTANSLVQNVSYRKC